MKHAAEDDDIIFCAVWVYLMYSAYNDVRNSPQREWNESAIADLIKVSTRSLQDRRGTMTGRVLSLPIKDWVAVRSSAWGALHSSDQLGTAASLSNSPPAILVVF